MDTIHIINLKQMMAKQTELRERLSLPGQSALRVHDPSLGPTPGATSLESLHAEGEEHSLVKVSPGISQLSKLVECIQSV